jgi:ribose transport system substrate-binding protein
LAVLIFAACTPASFVADSDVNVLSGNSNLVSEDQKPSDLVSKEQKSKDLVSEEQKSSDPASEEQKSGGPGETARRAVDFDHELDSYKPLKDRYNFYFTYKTVHPWWDAVALGMEEAQRQYLYRGVTITYEYMAPEGASAEDQTKRLLMAKQQDYDVIGVDVADESIISPIIDELVDSGVKVMTFSSSDAAEGCKRIAYVGNTHNYQDGKDLTEALCEKLGFKGKVAILVGSVGAPCHEDRARGARDAIAQYEGMEIVATEYDMDSVDKAYDLTMQILKDTPDLDGIICCNMSNPVGAARAITETESSAVIVGMDHDKEALRFLDDGVIYCLGVQDCYSIGFDTIQTAVKIADGNLAGELFPEKKDEITTVIFQNDAALMLEILYGED